jgi:hypothetical protein
MWRTQKPYPEKLPERLLEMAQKDPSIKLMRENVLDYGPVTKLAPILDVEKDPNTVILTIDDDTLYEKFAFSAIYKRMEEKQFQCAISSRGLIVGNNWYDQFGMVWSDTEWKEVDIVEGVGGATYCRGFFPNSTAEFVPPFPKRNKSDIKTERDKFEHALFYNDDIWISGKLASRGIKRFVYPKSDNTSLRIDSDIEISGQTALSRDFAQFLFRRPRAAKYFKELGLFNLKQNAEPGSTIGFFAAFILLFVPLIVALVVVAILVRRTSSNSVNGNEVLDNTFNFS